MRNWETGLQCTVGVGAFYSPFTYAFLAMLTKHACVHTRFWVAQLSLVTAFLLQEQERRTQIKCQSSATGETHHVTC